MTELNADLARRAMVEHTRRLAESAAEAGPDAKVPTAPEWTIRDLVKHLGETQHWAAEIVERRVTDPTLFPTEMAPFPADPGEWSAWLAESGQRVADSFTDEALEAEIFNPAGDERPGARFWLTSQLNEAVVHGFDGENAAGRTPDIHPDVAAALISNHLDMLTSPTWAALRKESADAISGTGQTLLWVATDADDAWFVEQRPDGATWQNGTQKADVTVTGPAQSLLLTLVRRLRLTDEVTKISIEGDADLAQHWLDNTAHNSD